jgi:cytidylate kinase
MSDKETVYKGELDDFDVVDLESPLVGARGEVCDYYCSAYGRDAGKAREDGDNQKADVFQFLGVLTSFHLNQGDPSRPYTPMWQMEGRRSLVPDDLADSDYIAVRRVAERVTDPALRARCFDVLWLKEKNHQDCREAVASYLESAKHLDDDDRWVHAVSQYRRGIKLASKIGRQNEPFQEISTALCSAIEAKNDEEDGFRTCQLLAIANEAGCGVPEAWAKIAFEIGERAVKSGDFRRAREYWMLEEGFKRAAKDGDGADSAALRVAEAFVSEGMARVEGANASYMAAASFLKNGVEALRRARAPRVRIEEVKAKLAEFQELSLGEMKSYEYSHDISEMVQGARDHGGFSVLANNL